MSDGPDPDLMDLASRLRGVIAGLSRRLNASAASEGLTPSQASALQVLSWRGPQKLSDLAAIEGLNPTMLSRIVKKLDEDGLLRRRQDPHDLRSALVEATEEGKKVAENIRHSRARVVADALAEMPVETRSSLQGALTALESLRETLKAQG